MIKKINLVETIIKFKSKKKRDIEFELLKNELTEIGDELSENLEPNKKSNEFIYSHDYKEISVYVFNMYLNLCGDLFIKNFK